MNTTRLAALRGQVGAFLITPAIFTGDIGGRVYAISRAFWRRLLWPWVLAGVAGLVIYGAWWLFWQLPKRQVERLRLTIRDPEGAADVMLRGVIVAAVGLILLVVGTGVGFLGARHGWWSAETAAALPTISPAPSTPIASINTTPISSISVSQFKEGGAMKRHRNVSCLGQPKGTPFWCGPTEQCVCQ